MVRTHKRRNSVVAGHDLKSQMTLQLMVLPAIIIVVLMSYFPMYGIVIAFKNYNIFKGIEASPWAANGGFEHFIDFFSTESCWRVIGNTLYIAVLKLALCTWPPIVLAVLLNELRSPRYMKTVQTLSYLPHFIGWSIAYGIFYNLLNPSSGALNILLKNMGLISNNINFLADGKFFDILRRGLGVLQDACDPVQWKDFV